MAGDKSNLRFVPMAPSQGTIAVQAFLGGMSRVKEGLHLPSSTGGQEEELDHRHKQRYEGSWLAADGEVVGVTRSSDSRR